MAQFNASATGVGGNSGFSAGGAGLGGEAAVELQGISVTVSGNTLTMKRTYPSPSTSAAVFSVSGSVMTLDGDSEFDFNLDGTPEPALAHFELTKG